jgi:hypothetical protein
VERKSLESAFATVGRDKLTWDFLKGPVTLDRLEEEMRKGYHVLHVLSHGTFSTTKQQAALFLQNQDGTVRNVLDDELAGMLARQGVQPHLVFLAACQSATRSTADAFLGLGPKLVSIGVPAVVAMQDVVTVATARKFSEVFYRQLIERGQVDLATNEARSTLLTARRPDAAVPVLFMRLKSGRLWAEEDLNDIGQPAQPKPGWNTSVIRDLLTAAFSDEELTTLCFDHFRPVYEDFASGMSKGQKIQRLLDHCARQGQIDPLLVLVQKRNPAQYARLKLFLKA